jgi:hypothetical protein
MRLALNVPHLAAQRCCSRLLTLLPQTVTLEEELTTIARAAELFKSLRE